MFSTIKELIDHPDFVALVDEKLRELIEEQPEFTYRSTSDATGCYYDRGPDSNAGRCDGCIFGQAFQRLGIPKSDLDSRLGFLIGIYGEGEEGLLPTIGQFPGAPEY